MKGRFRQDLRYALRILRQNPVFAGAIILTFAVSIGANSAFFTIVSSVLLKPLPYADADRLVSISTQFPEQHLSKFPASEPEYLDYRNANKSFSQLAAHATLAANLAGPDSNERVQVAYATANLFPLLGAHPAIGRVFNAAEDSPGGDAVVVLSSGLWKRHFGAAPQALGKVVRLNGVQRTVIGVMPETFRFPSNQVDAWLPLGIDTANPDGRASHYLSMIGRLADGATLLSARNEATSLMKRWDHDLGGSHHPGIPKHPLVLSFLRDEIAGDVRKPLLVLFGAVGFVLLIACTNVASLTLARGFKRHREIAVRAALGASRARVMKQLLTESLLLATAGGVLGLLSAIWIVDALAVIVHDFIPQQNDVALDWRVFCFTAVIAFASAIISGIVPALQLSKPQVADSLRNGGYGSRRHRTVNLLVAGEVAIAVVLLTGAALMTKSYVGLQSVDPGFQTENILTLQISLPRRQYSEVASVAGFYDNLLSRVRWLPGVDSAATISNLPLSSLPPPEDITIEGRVPRPNDPPTTADLQLMNGDYFRLMRIRLVEGRLLSASDLRKEVAVVNRSLAQSYFRDVSPIGKRIRLGGPHSENPWLLIVGVAEDVKQSGLDAGSRPEIFAPVLQGANYSILSQTATLLVKTSMDPLSLAPAVRGAIREIDPSIPPYHIATMKQVMSSSLARPRLSVILMTAFAGVAFLLAMIGVYSLMSHSVSWRRKEIGIRMALGAQKSEIFEMVLRRGGWLTLNGVAVGLVCAVAMSRVLSGLLFEVNPTDPLLLALVGAGLVLASLTSCVLPARRAIRLEPMAVLKHE